MDLQQELQKICLENNGTILLQDIPERIYQKPRGVSPIYAAFHLGFCGLAYFWLAINENKDFFLIAIDDDSDGSINTFIKILLNLDKTPSNNLEAREHNMEILRGRHKFLNDRHICFAQSLIPKKEMSSHLNLVPIQAFDFICIEKLTSHILAKPARNLIYLYCHFDETKSFRNKVFYRKGRGHVFSVTHKADGTIILFDWRGGVYELSKDKIFVTLLSMLRKQFEFYSIDSADPWVYCTLREVTISESQVSNNLIRFAPNNNPD
ncbi:hypothetical protein [Pelagibaculum spongiae]|uniref:Uncharacterized protein n=1 Tax=Pelagibaculum spongiae TaxID=2080658 RepID=A0A2V1GSN7_9GAMM|nr:hypothetical protein [Pelagibaculum spongiae]PVZ66386.1 hypothetical protein DC094_16970 [Pelagibaculum spongiae]